MGPERVVIGEIVRPHGVRGEVRVRPLTAHPDRFLELAEVYVEGVPRRVRSARVAADGVILALEGCNDRDGAAVLRGRLLEVDAPAVHRLPEGEYYWFQLRGLRVFTTEGRPVGRVVEVEPNPAHDLLVVEEEGMGPQGAEGARARRFLVPAVRALIAEVDLEGGRLVVRDIPGLLE